MAAGMAQLLPDGSQFKVAQLEPTKKHGRLARMFRPSLRAAS
jgi:hypothetical protein